MPAARCHRREITLKCCILTVATWLFSFAALFALQNYRDFLWKIKTPSLKELNRLELALKWSGKDQEGQQMHLQALQCFCKTWSQLGSSTLLTCTRKLPTERALLAATHRLTGRQRCCFLTAPTRQHPESGCVGWDSCSAAETRKSAETKNLVGLEKRLNYVQMGWYLIKSLMNRDSSLLNVKPSGSHLFVFFSPTFCFKVHYHFVQNWFHFSHTNCIEWVTLNLAHKPGPQNISSFYHFFGVFFSPTP